jgi:hypothetical protein
LTLSTICSTIVLKLLRRYESNSSPCVISHCRSGGSREGSSANKPKSPKFFDDFTRQGGGSTWAPPPHLKRGADQLFAPKTEAKETKSAVVAPKDGSKDVKQALVGGWF